MLFDDNIGVGIIVLFGGIIASVFLAILDRLWCATIISQKIVATETLISIHDDTRLFVVSEREEIEKKQESAKSQERKNAEAKAVEIERKKEDEEKKRREAETKQYIEQYKKVYGEKNKT